MAYVANYDSGSVSAFEVSSEGALSFVGRAPAAAGTHEVAIHPSGRFAYAVNEIDVSLSLYSIDSTTGMLAPLPTSRVAAPGVFDALQIHPSGSFAYSHHYDDDLVSMWTIDQDTGVLAFDHSISVPAEPTCMVLEPAGKFLFVALIDGRILTFGVDTAGQLTERHSVTGEADASALAISRTGSFMYAGVRDNVVVRSIGPDGRLGQAVFAGDTHAASISVDASGRLFCVCGGEDQTITLYAANSDTGVLTEVASEPVGAGPLNSAAISPSGRTVYAVVANNDGQTPGRAIAYAVDENARALIELAPLYTTEIDPFGITVVNVAG